MCRRTLWRPLEPGLPGLPPILDTPLLLRDLAGRLSGLRLRAAVDSALHQRLVKVAALDEVTGANGRGNKGARLLTQTVAVWRPEYESIAEQRAGGKLVGAGHVIRPQWPVPWLDGSVFHRDFLVDGVLPLDIDGLAFHSSKYAKRRDRRCDDRLEELGYEPLRIEAEAVMTGSAWLATVDRRLARIASRVA